MDSSSWADQWQLTPLAGEVVRRRRRGRVVFLVGWGPPVGGGDRPQRLVALHNALGSDVRAVRCCRQIHGRLLASLGEEPGQPPSGAAEVGACDGLLTDCPGVVLVVWTADCVPVLMAGGGVVAAVHAGWRGASAGIVTAAVRRFEVEYGVSASEMTAVLGPAIGPCHYPVGGDVVAALGSTVPDTDDWHDDGRIDLRRVVAHQLEGAGLDSASLECVGGCTACDPGLASFRRDGSQAGRQWSAVLISAS